VVCRNVLLISRDESFIRSLRWYLEDRGVPVQSVPALEELFLAHPAPEPGVVILDLESLSSEAYWQAQRQLDWLCRRCAVLLVGEGESNPLECAYGGFSRKPVSPEFLMERIQNL